MLPKPAHGGKCNGCGRCCVDQRCPLAVAVFGKGGSCPALEVRFPAFVCGLVENPQRYAPSIVQDFGQETASRSAAILVGAGIGCDALLAGETLNNEWRQRAIAALDPCATQGALAIWLR